MPHAMQPNLATRHAIALRKFQQLQQEGYGAELEATLLRAQRGENEEEETGRAAQIASNENTAANAYAAAAAALAEVHALQEQLPAARPGRWARIRAALR